MTNQKLEIIATQILKSLSHKTDEAFKKRVREVLMNHIEVFETSIITTYEEIRRREAHNVPENVFKKRAALKLAETFVSEKVTIDTFTTPYGEGQKFSIGVLK